MFPNVNGFHWTFGHIFFVSVFMAVLATLLFTAATAFLRVVKDLKLNRAGAIRWREDFHDLPAQSRKCRHEINGEVEHRICPFGFDCRECDRHHTFVMPAPATDATPYGLVYPPGRLYHRGHTWVEQNRDGSVTIGLDEIAKRLVGHPDLVELPAPGTNLANNSVAWRMQKNGLEMRILAPIDGEVISTGGPQDEWYLRVKPTSTDFRHLLRGEEVRHWVGRELERLQMMFTPEGEVPALADGGVLMHDLIANVPEAQWDGILGEVFLEP